MLLLERLIKLLERIMRFLGEVFWVSWREMLGWGDEERGNVVLWRVVRGSVVLGRGVRDLEREDWGGDTGEELDSEEEVVVASLVDLSLGSEAGAVGPLNVLVS